jgi:hypothetical protein
MTGEHGAGKSRQAEPEAAQPQREGAFFLSVSMVVLQQIEGEMK